MLSMVKCYSYYVTGDNQLGQSTEPQTYPVYYNKFYCERRVANRGVQARRVARALQGRAVPHVDTVVVRVLRLVSSNGVSSPTQPTGMPSRSLTVPVTDFSEECYEKRVKPCTAVSGKRRVVVI